MRSLFVKTNGCSVHSYIRTLHSYIAMVLNVVVKYSIWYCSIQQFTTIYNYNIVYKLLCSAEVCTFVFRFVLTLFACF